MTRTVTRWAVLLVVCLGLGFGYAANLANTPQVAVVDNLTYIEGK